MNKSEVCVRLTRKNCKKVLGVLEMFGEAVYFTTKEWLGVKDIEYPYINFDRASWSGRYVFDGKTLIKPRELRNILAKEHLKVGDVVFYKVSYKWCGIVDRIEGDMIYFSKAVCLNDNTIYEDGFERLSEFNFLRYATDEEKALLEPKTTIVTLNPVATFTGSIPGQATYTREVWANHYSDHEFYVYKTRYGAESDRRPEDVQTVKATLTYDIPMTKV